MSRTLVEPCTHAVLNAITAFAQDIILKVEKLKPGKEIFDEVADLKGTLVVSQSDRVNRQTRLS